MFGNKEKSLDFNREEALKLLESQGFKIKLEPGTHTVWDMVEVRADDTMLQDVMLTNNYEPFMNGMKVVPNDNLSLNNKPSVVPMIYFKKQKTITIDKDGKASFNN